ncbi:MAG: class I SAM-dependent methyltransferase, partial [Deltaproteobacteria bacterium]|nr:class I SAM-dependent methyltransferase [Deltaproteobacteria bacterium]
GEIFEMAGAYQKSAILKAAVELDVFTKISNGQDSVEKMASSIGASERGVRILLDALCALGMISKAEDKYQLTKTTDQFFVKDKSSYMGHTLFSILTDWEAFGKVAESVKTGSPAVDMYGAESKVWEDVSKGLIQSGLMTAAIISDILGIGDKMQPGVNVLDLACGSGVYGYVLLQRDSTATVTGIDWQNVLDLADKTAKEMGVGDRATFKPGDILSIDYGDEEFDIALASNILQAFDPETNRVILGKIFKALKPGGTLVINDFVPDDNRSKAKTALNFAVYMLIVTQGGDAYIFPEFESWLKDTGFHRVAQQRIPVGTTIITATRPG